MNTSKFRSFTCLFVVVLLLIPSILPAEQYGLEDLYRAALQIAEKIKIAEENVKIAESGRSKAMSYLLPRVTTFASFSDYAESKYSPPSTTTVPGGSIVLPGTLIQPNTAGSWGIRLDESLSLGGREITSFQIASENLEKNRLDAYAVKEDYLLAVAVAYFNALKAEKNLDIAEANVQRLTTYRKAAAQRLRVGEVTKTVLLRAEAELSGAMSDRMAAQNNLELAMVQLKRIVGLEIDVRLKRETLGGRDDIPSVDAYLTIALTERSDLKGLEVQKKLTERQVRYAHGAHWPSISIFGVYSGLDQSPASTTINRESIYAGVTLNFPIFEGGLRQAEVDEARSKNRQSGFLYDDLKRTIQIEVQAAYLDLMTQKTTLKYLEDQVAFARDNYQAVNRQFEFGLVSSIDVMDANMLLVSAERKLSEAGYNYQIAFTKMKRASGVLLKEILSKN